MRDQKQVIEESKAKIQNGSCDRESNYELLRILSMFMVLILHVLGHGGVLENYRLGSAGYVLFYGMETMAYISVNLFVLISGYFMVEASAKRSRVFRLLVQVWFYSLLCVVLKAALFQERIEIKELIYAMFPVTSNQYWFVGAYVVMLILAPMMNSMMQHMNQKQHMSCILTLVLVFSVVPTIFFWSRNWLCDGNSFVWFIVLYNIAAHIKLYEDSFPAKLQKIMKSRGAMLAVYLLFSGGGVLSRLLIGNASKLLLGEERGTELLYSYNSIIFLLAAVSLFLLFGNIRITKPRLARRINRIAALTFGAYLLTDHDLIRNPLWSAINMSQYFERGIFITFVNVILVALVLLVVGCATEWLRRIIFRFLHVERIFYAFAKGARNEP